MKGANGRRAGVYSTFGSHAKLNKPNLATVEYRTILEKSGHQLLVNIVYLNASLRGCEVL